MAAAVFILYIGCCLLWSFHWKVSVHYCISVCLIRFTLNSAPLTFWRINHVYPDCHEIDQGKFEEILLLHIFNSCKFMLNILIGHVMFLRRFLNRQEKVITFRRSCFTNNAFMHFVVITFVQTHLQWCLKVRCLIFALPCSR